MSIENLIQKINEKINLIEPQTVRIMESVPNTPKELEELHSKELSRLLGEIQSWLQTHECQTGTNNTLDVNDRPYDSAKYEEKLQELYAVTAAYFSRPVGEEIEDK